MRLTTITEGKRPYTIAVDLDGTIAQKDDKHSQEILDPDPEAERILAKLKELGARIIIYTVRGNVEQIETWLKRHNIPYDHINHNPDQPEDASGKIIADEYWDDRAIGWPGLQKAYERSGIHKRTGDETLSNPRGSV